jgi:FtsZ-binding cell division protein ZapB
MSTPVSTDLNQKVTQIQDTVSDLSSQVTDMHQQMNKIYTAIVGDKNFGHLGLVSRVERLEQVKKKWENKMNWLYGYVIGAGVVLAGVYELIKALK